MADDKFSKLFESLETSKDLKTPIQEIHELKPKKSANEKQFSFWLDKDLLKALKREAFERECSIKEIICEGIELYFKRTETN